MSRDKFLPTCLSANAIVSAEDNFEKREKYNEMWEDTQKVTFYKHLKDCLFYPFSGKTLKL